MRETRASKEIDLPMLVEKTPKFGPFIAETLGNRVEGCAWQASPSAPPNEAWGFARSLHEEKNASVPWDQWIRANIASISKPVTAVAVLRLMEEGRVNIWKPFFSHLGPYLEARGLKITPGKGIDKVTVADLLAMKGCLKPYPELNPPQGDEETRSRPALAVFNDRLWLAFRGNTHLWVTSYDGRKWTRTNMTDKNGAKTGEGPALAAFGGQLFLAYRGEDETKVFLCTSPDGEAWSPQAFLDPKGGKGALSAESPALAAYWGNLFLAWRSDADGADRGFQWCRFGLSRFEVVPVAKREEENRAGH